MSLDVCGDCAPSAEGVVLLAIANNGEIDFPNDGQFQEVALVFLAIIIPNWPSNPQERSMPKIHLTNSIQEYDWRQPRTLLVNSSSSTPVQEFRY